MSHTITQHLLVLVLVTLIRLYTSQDIRLPPDILEGPEVYRLFRPGEKNVQLKCFYSASPAASIEWRKNNVSFDLNSPDLTVLYGGQLVEIKSARRSDEGAYQCFVKNAYGRAMSDVAVLQMAILEDFVSGVGYYTGFEGVNFTLSCNQAPHSVPSATYSWSSVTGSNDENPNRITKSPRIQIDSNGNLRFSYLTMNDNLGGRQYKCNVFNSALDVIKGGSYSKVTVNPSVGSTSGFRPQLMFSSADQTVGLLSSNVSLRCFFSSNPDAQIKWSKKGGTLPGGRYETNRLDSYDSELFIRNLVSEDEGVYVCTGSNVHGVQEKQLQLIIESVPVFTRIEDRPHNQNVTEGQSVTMRCAPQSTPPAQVTWFRNTEPLSPLSLPRNYRLSSDGQTLTVTGVCKVCDESSLAVIQCRAYNIHGSTYSQGYLNVQVSTRILNASMTVMPEGGEEIRLPCSYTTDESTPVLEPVWYYRRDDQTMEQLVIYDDHLIYYDKTSSELRIKILNDSAGVETRLGQYRCAVTGVYGHNSDSITHYLISPQPIVTQASMTWLFILFAVLIIIIIIFVICFMYTKNNKGGSYLVDEKERKNGNHPEQELLDSGFQHYQRPSGGYVHADRASLSSSDDQYIEDDTSLNAYASDAGQFIEDGSFIGQYVTERSARH